MAPSSQSELFVRLFLSEQRRLLGYACVLVGDVNAAEDVLSEATVVLWGKFGEFEPGSNFGAWASQIVRHKALDYHRSQRRDRLVLDERLLEMVAEEASAMRSHYDDEFDALETCLRVLDHDDIELLMKRYSGQISVEALARSIGRSTVTLRKMLNRIQRNLLKCIGDRLAEEKRA